MSAQEIVEFLNDGKTTIEVIEMWRKNNQLKADRKTEKGEWLFRMQDVHEFLR